MFTRLGHEIEIGHLLDNRFEITALIARSGMATVFQAIDRQTRQMVAIKAPRADFATSRTSLARLAREAAVLGKLNHPGIPKSSPLLRKAIHMSSWSASTEKLCTTF